MQLYVRQRAVSARKRLSGGMPGQPPGCPVGCEGTNRRWVCLRGQHPCASPVALTGRTGCVGTENAPSSQGRKPLRKVFSGRATIEKSRKENRSANKSHEKATAVGTPSAGSARRTAERSSSPAAEQNRAPLCPEAPNISVGVSFPAVGQCSP